MGNTEHNIKAEELQKKPGNTGPGDSDQGHYFMAEDSQPLGTEDGQGLETESKDDAALENGAKVDQ